MTTFDPDKLQQDLIMDEGFRLLPYKDSRGYVTIGIGRNLTTNGLSPTEVAFLFQNDVVAATAGLDEIWPWWRTMPEPVQRVLVNLCFNMGPEVLKQFVLFAAALQAGNWQLAANDLKNSRWWTEVGGRGPRMVARLLEAKNVV